MVELQLQQAVEFLAALDFGGRRDAPHTFQTFDDTKDKDQRLARIVHGPLRQHGDLVEELNSRRHAGIYVTVNATDLTGRKAENIVSPRATFCDFDEVEPGPEADALPCSIRVRSGRGPHLYWLLKPRESLERWSFVQEALARRLGADLACKDAPRVMRLPGFLHQKGEPVLVRMEFCYPTRRYTLDEITEAFGIGDWVRSMENGARWDKTSQSYVKAKPRTATSPTRPVDQYDRRLERVQSYMDTVEGVPEGGGDEGGRNNYLAKKLIPTLYAFGVHRNEADGFVNQWNNRNAPPLPWREVEVTLDRVYQSLEGGSKVVFGAKLEENSPEWEERQRKYEQRQAAREADEQARWEATLSAAEEEAERQPYAPRHRARAPSASNAPPDPPWPSGELPGNVSAQWGPSGTQGPGASGPGARAPEALWPQKPTSPQGGGGGGLWQPPGPPGGGGGGGGDGPDRPEFGGLPDLPMVALGPDGLPMTSVGNAQRFIRDYGAWTRYVPTWKRWLYWDGNRWCEDRDSEEGEEDTRGAGAVMELAMMCTRSMMQWATRIPQDSEERGKWVSHCRQSEKRTNIEATLVLAGAMRSVAVPPSLFDRPKDVINTPTGIVNLRTLETAGPQKQMFLSKRTRVSFRDAECPTWLRFLHDVMDGNEDLVSFLQRSVGYSITGETNEQVLWLLYGTGANGKSTFLSMLEAIAGEYHQNTEFGTFLERQADTVRNDLARLHRSRLVTAIEPKASRRMDEAVIKSVTGEDPITARFLFREYFTFRPTFKLWLASNHKPEIRGNDEGIWRRILMVPFTVRIPKAKRDRDLPRKLAAELPGIFRWACEGAKQWYADGLQVPEIVRDATKEYRHDMDSLGVFIEAHCLTDIEEGEPKLSVRLKLLYDAYKKWAVGAGEKPMAQKSFSQRLSERGFRRSTRKSYGYDYLGLALRDDPDKRPAEGDPRFKDD